MGNPILYSNVRGSVAPLLQHESRDFDPTHGFLYRYDFRGLSLQQMINLQGDYIRDNIACRLTFRNGVADLEVEDSTQQFTIDTWQILGNEVQLSILSHPTILAMDLDNHDLRVLSTAFQNQDQDWDDVYSQMHDIGNSIVLERFYSLYLRGTTDYQRGQYVLRHTTNAPSIWSQNVADTNVDTIYSTAQLLSEVQNSGLWIFPLPGRLAYKIGAIPVLGPQANYEFGWLKHAATETTAANNRIDISTEYTLELWTTDLYKPNGFTQHQEGG